MAVGLTTPVQTRADADVREASHVQRIFALGRPYLGRILTCLALIVAASTIQLSLPLGIRYIFDRMLVEGQASVIHLATLALLAVFVLRSIISFFGQFLLQVTGDLVIVDLRAKLFEQLHLLDHAFHSGQRIGDLVSRITNDVASIRNVIANLSISFAINIFMLLGASVIMLAMNWRLGLVVLAVTPLTSLTTRLFGPYFKRISTRIQSELAASTVIAQESLAGMEVIKGFARADHEFRRYRNRLARFMVVVIKARRLDATFNAIVAFLTSSSTIVIFWYGGLQVIEGSLTAGALVAFLLYSQNITQSISSIAQHYAAFSQAMGASSRVFEIMAMRPEVSERADARPLHPGPAHLDLRHVAFDYGGKAVLKDVNLSVQPGQTVALVGASGAGKSTLFKLLSRFYDPTAGSIEINGVDIRDYTLKSLRSAISVVSQDVFLFGGSVRENIRYGRLDATDDEIEGAARLANAHEFVQAMPEGYDTPVGERGAQLSGGQRQRISIARALLKNAPILLLDEATSALDPESERLVQEAIERVSADRTTLVIAHRSSTVEKSRMVFRLDEGRLEPVDQRHAAISNVSTQAPAPLTLC
ncbi:ABC transporter ATP-binding protein/permease [Luteimonas sp. S4-F44]|uniref:ABC transporter ATP-binding protein n=1 Tax=Luteimonas sp. S4-F44 TaxID=2925842 RepID=UPI001F538390|nr:ABC transporter ATP-binding protein [Luteimonas sp. S4-F44]UNK42018.1 ABC transporter ATP-binding protein/permease [Luteimonas sp. S4-F44]